MEISQQGKNAIILVAKKRIERIELRLKDLGLEISELKQFFATLPEDIKFIPDERAPAPTPPKPKLAKKKKEASPVPVIEPEPEEPLMEELPDENPMESETIEFEAQMLPPKAAKQIVHQGELSAVEIKALRLIATLEESEHQLPYIAGRLNMGQTQVQAILEQLSQKGLIYSHDPTSQEAEYDMDQKGLEYLSKKGLL